jgi:hypothetical protein
VREWRQFVVLGALGMWVCGAFVYVGGHSTSAVNIGLLYAAPPVAIAVLSALSLRERMSGAAVARRRAARPDQGPLAGSRTGADQSVRTMPGSPW